VYICCEGVGHYLQFRDTKGPNPIVVPQTFSSILGSCNEAYQGPESSGGVRAKKREAGQSRSCEGELRSRMEHQDALESPSYLSEKPPTVLRVDSLTGARA